jgi:mannose-6-phosphate isomerase
VRTFSAPVDDFELSVADVAGPGTLPGRGPRVVLCLSGDVTLKVADGERMTLRLGEAAFVAASEGGLDIDGLGTVVQADVP